MPCLTDPDAEARRVALVRVAVALRKPWLESTGARTVGGKRAAAQNRLRHGAGSLAFKAAMAYVDVIATRLLHTSEKQPYKASSEFKTSVVGQSIACGDR